MQLYSFIYTILPPFPYYQRITISQDLRKKLGFRVLSRTNEPFNKSLDKSLFYIISLFRSYPLGRLGRMLTVITQPTFFFLKLLVSPSGLHFLKTFIFSVQETKFSYPFSLKLHFKSAKVSLLRMAGFFHCIWQLMIIYFQLLATNIRASCSNIWLHLEHGVHTPFPCP